MSFFNPIQQREKPVGDSVVVKAGILDPDFKIDIGGWQGRIISVSEFAGKTEFAIHWDSITLKSIPFDLIDNADNA